MPALSQAPGPGYAELFAQVRDGLPGDQVTRKRHFERFTELGLPTQRAEVWKYTSLAPLAALAPRWSSGETVSSEVVEAHFDPEASHRFVFIDGVFSPDLSTTDNLPEGLSATTLAAAVADDVSVLDDLEADRSLTALNGAFAREGVVLRVAPGQEVAKPVQLVFVTSGDTSVLTSPRNRILVGAGGSLKVVETHVALGEGGVTNLVNVIDVEAEATLIHDRVAFGGTSSLMVAKTYQTLGTRAESTQTCANIGGRLVRNENLAKLIGPHALLTLNGVFMPHEAEHVDNMILIEHLAPNCESNQYYKGVLLDGGHGVFAGKILVAQEAQKTNAYQKNDNLMLSRNAEIDTKPELEIYADDVKCSHGATVGELDRQGLFYLRSRGLDLTTAKTLLTFAFAGEVLERFDSEACQHEVRRAILERLPGGERLMELV